MEEELDGKFMATEVVGSMNTIEMARKLHSVRVSGPALSIR